MSKKNKNNTSSVPTRGEGMNTTNQTNQKETKNVSKGYEKQNGQGSK